MTQKHNLLGNIATNHVTYVVCMDWQQYKDGFISFRVNMNTVKQTDILKNIISMVDVTKSRWM